MFGSPVGDEVHHERLEWLALRRISRTMLTYCHQLLPKLICSHQLSRGGFTLDNVKHESGHQISCFYRNLSYTLRKEENQFSFSCKIVSVYLLWVYFF